MDASRAQKLASILYQDSNGYAISNDGKRDAGLTDDRAFTYGEIAFDTFDAILAAANPIRHGVFVDLGSGTGKAVMMAALLGAFRTCVGIELVPKIWAEAERIRQRFDATVAPLMAKEEPVPTVEFRQADFLISDWSNADCVFVQATCMPYDLVKQLTKKIELLRPGSRAIVATTPLQSTTLESRGEGRYRLGWGNATIYFYEVGAR